MHDPLPEQVAGKAGGVLAYERSLAVALATGAQPNYCYANVWHAMLKLPELQEARLIEGWIVLAQASSVSVIEHCWYVCEDRLIVDPSIVLLMRRAHPVSYFPGAQRTRAEVEVLACHELPCVRSVGRYGPDGMGHAGYRAAYHAAYEHAQLLAQASKPSKTIVVHPAEHPSPQTAHFRLTVRTVSSETFLRGTSRHQRYNGCEHWLCF